ncbi:MAG: DHH family phosphoesterase [Candidatus Altiarchaeota archaeon]
MEDKPMSDEFWGDIQEFSKRVVAQDDYFVVGHHDADGISSCAITVSLLRSLGKDVAFKCIKQLDSTTVKHIEPHKEKCIVFTDFGSGHLSLIEEHGIEDCYIIDHHPPEREDERQINPHFYGYDGGIDVSGAGMAYLVSRALGKTDTAHIAVVGAVGDMQDSRGRLFSLNRLILDDAVGQGLLHVEHDIRLFGRQSRTIAQMLAYSSEPVLPGLSGNPQASAQFLQSKGIEVKNPDGSWRSYVELGPEEREKLLESLYIHLLESNTPEFIIQGMVGEVYTLVKEEFKSELRDAKEFATVLNACGRQEQPELGVEVCLGDRGVKWSKAQGMLEKHRSMLRKGIEFLKDNGVTELDNLYYFNAGDAIKESLVGVVAGMAYGAGVSGMTADKPILGFAVDRDDGTRLKVSARANWGLVRRGIHLGKAMRDCSKEFDGEGGGHDIAAGARIPGEKLVEFLDSVNKAFGGQVS